MPAKSFVGTIVLLVIVMIAAMSVYIVQETERAVLLKFGEIVKPDIEPGLHVKIPFINSVKKFDARILTVDVRPESFLTVEKKGVEVDWYAKWKIADVSKFYTATNGEERRADILLSQRINTGLRNQFGERTLHEVISGERDELMTELTTLINGIAYTEFGIEVVDVRVKQIDLPPSVSGAVYSRMQTERQREAAEHRSQGRELAEGIKADADRKRIIIEAEAYREAERTRGEGDAVAAAVYARAYNKDPEFYSFTRSLKAYQESFNSKGDVLLIDPDSDYFRYLNDSRGK